MRMWNLVLGGTRGIGYAFANEKARANERIILVSRNTDGALNESRKRLIKNGAKEVISRKADLVNTEERSFLLESLAKYQIRTVFIGGPSPPSEEFDQLKIANFRQAHEICVIYPLTILDWITSEQLKCSNIYLVSSSAASEPLQGNNFFLSGLYRRSMDLFLEEWFVSQKTKRNVRVLRPKVVWTSLAESFARSNVRGKSSRKKEREFLLDYFSVQSIPTAKDYIKKIIKKNLKKSGLIYFDI